MERRPPTTPAWSAGDLAGIMDRRPPAGKIMNLHQSILYGEQILSQNAIPDPRWNSERLLILAVQQPRSKIYTELERELTQQELKSFEELIHKRAQHYPLAYLEGTQEFFGREFFVNEAVLIPRPETEGIVRAVLDLKINEPVILDLASGSGVIAVTLALEVTRSRVFALELSSDAISILRQNSENRVSIVRADFGALPFLSHSFDVIAANLPYVEAADFANLPEETKWEPRTALVTSSLEHTYLTAVRQSARALKPGGYLVLEIGYEQSERLQNVLANESMVIIDLRRDHQNIPRVMILKSLR
jgi:release factor glutamine methyltransferase